MHYSPVRHSLQSCPRNVVRLACVRHAASVQSEPGSNSSVQSIRLLLSLKVNGVTSLLLVSTRCIYRAPVNWFAAPLTSSTHTYRLQIFKERWLRGEDLNL